MYSAGFGSKGLTLIFFKKKLKPDGKPETGRQSSVRFVCGCQLSECEANLTSLFFFIPVSRQRVPATPRLLGGRAVNCSSAGRTFALRSNPGSKHYLRDGERNDQ